MSKKTPENTDSITNNPISTINDLYKHLKSATNSQITGKGLKEASTAHGNNA